MLVFSSVHKTIKAWCIKKKLSAMLVSGETERASNGPIPSFPSHTALPNKISEPNNTPYQMTRAVSANPSVASFQPVIYSHSPFDLPSATRKHRIHCCHYKGCITKPWPLTGPLSAAPGAPGVPPIYSICRFRSACLMLALAFIWPRSSFVLSSSQRLLQTSS